MIERIQIYAWDGVEMLRGVPDAVKWPFERLAWVVERGLIWPLGERTASWSRPLRTSGVAALALVAIGAGVLGLRLASDSGTAGEVTAAAPVVAAPVAAQPIEETPAPAAPVLQGAAPDFKPEADSGASKVASAAAIPAAATPKADASTPSSSPAAKAEPAGPAALQVARQFAGAFVLFETGVDNEEVRTVFAKTATPQLSRSLLQRPPRLPANAKVPQAKVLNIVAGPQHGETYTLSVSLLRLGVTSELRVTMERDKASGDWQVTDVIG
ncbi:MAG TPA: hypothetical protein VFT10_03790 [Solirubrobacterales bacterium]|nr:hypothetical protein [Solirubrobacterales bacterium]